MAEEATEVIIKCESTAGKAIIPRPGKLGVNASGPLSHGLARFNLRISETLNSCFNTRFLDFETKEISHWFTCKTVVK